MERVLAVVSNPAAKKMTPWAVMRSVGNFKNNLDFLCHFDAAAVMAGVKPSDLRSLFDCFTDCTLLFTLVSLTCQHFGREV